MQRTKNRFKKGAASFYIVAFSTLILLIVATSFAAIIISELNRTMNEDLSQSAYDSAMAGVEDAKLAYYNYQNCVTNKENQAQGQSETPTSGSCENIIAIVENSANWGCDMVTNILGREEATIQESGTGNNMQQESTCVKIQTRLKDFRSNLSSSNQLRVIEPKFENDEITNKIKKIKISWYNDTSWGRSYSNFSGGKVIFPSITKALAMPPTISVAVLQTAENFNMSNFDTAIGNKTDRGMAYLVPTENSNAAANKNDDGKLNYIGTWNGGINHVKGNDFAKTNDKTATKLPYLVFCDPDSVGEEEFACSATIDLPEPVDDVVDPGNTKRNPKTFRVIVSLPYGNPSTNFAVEFICDDGETCGAESIEEEDGEANSEGENTAYLNGVQVEVDSTGRANDLYRRVVTRLQPSADSSYLSIMGPLELFGTGDSSASLDKNEAVKSEWNFK